MFELIVICLLSFFFITRNKLNDTKTNELNEELITTKHKLNEALTSLEIIKVRVRIIN